MQLKQELMSVATKVKGKFPRVFDSDQLEPLAHRSRWIQRSTSKLGGKDFVELLTTERLANAAVSLEGLCDILQKLHPPAAMTPPA